MVSQKKTIEVSKEEHEELLIDKIERLEKEQFKKEARIAELEKIVNE